MSVVRKKGFNLVFGAMAVGLSGILLPGIGLVGGSTHATAQSRTPPAGSSLALTAPVDQRRKQYRALPKTQRKFYKLQGYKRHRPRK